MADVDYGGSTGYGRAYRERLQGRWGVVDVDDCCGVAEDLAKQGTVETIGIVGGVLCCYEVRKSPLCK